jgi:hypothetical protein
VDAGQGVSWPVNKRYNDFRELRRALVAREGMAAKLLPDMPGKKAHQAGRLAKGQLDKRRAALEVGWGGQLSCLGGGR